jgi:hypothetical protein
VRSILLKIKVQNLKTENLNLRISSDLICSTNIDLKKIYMGQKARDKMGLRYIELLPSSVCKIIGSPKEKKKSSLKNKIKVTICKRKNITKEDIIMHINIDI